MIGIPYDFILKKYGAISFDIFDTLIERTVCLPSDVFELVGERKGLNAKCFREDRQLAEKEARKASESGETTLTQIYDRLKEKYSEEECNELMDEELRCELEVCKPRDDVGRLYEKCKKNGKRIMLISDMYLSAEAIEIMLAKCGIKGYEQLYVSNLYNCNKRDGQLFKKVLIENNIKEDALLHIGDSIKADYLGPHKAGVRAYLIPKRKIKKKIIKKILRIIKR